MEFNIDLSQFHNMFFEEAAEHIAQLEAGVLALETGPGQDVLDTIFRCAHSIKGASGSLGFDEIAGFTHSLETLLDKVRGGEIAPTRAITNLLLEAVDVLKTLLDSVRSGLPGAEPDKKEETIRMLMAASGQAAPERERMAPDAPPEPRSERVYAIRFAPSAGIFQMGMDPLLVVRDLTQLGEVLDVRPDLSRLPALSQLDAGTCYLAWTLRLKTECGEQQIRDVFAFVEDVAEIEIRREEQQDDTPAAAPQRPERTNRPAAHDSSLRVSTAKVDKLIDLVGELVIAQSMAGEILSNFTPDRLASLREAMAEMERHTRELQERVLSVRMLPVESLFSRFPRVVRDIAASLGKRVRLDMEGADTELDKSVVEQISDPLTHLVRNAVDHGIESPDERRRAGKPEEGCIRLKAFHQSGNILIEISDDGRGLDARRIRAKAVERGLIAEADELTEEQSHALIFQPGFSTCEEVSGLSGRGVGMDVVKRNVEELKGSVSIVSRPGRGATFRIKLPLTLAILDGLTMKVGQETYVAPLLAISESIRPRPEQVRVIPGHGEMIVLRGEPVPLVRLHSLFGVPTQATDPCQALAVIVEHIGSRMAVLVDELLGQQQVVIKSLETHYRKVDGVMGATILGDGKAALILDIAGIAHMARAAGALPRVAAADHKGVEA